MTTFKFNIGQLVTVESGKLYKVDSHVHYDRPQLKGERGYHVVGQRDGKRYGPVRLVRESRLRAVTAKVPT